MFDFDGTLTKKDSFLEFIKYYCGHANFIKGMLLNLPYLVLYKLNVVPNWKAKEKVLTYFFRGEDLHTFNKKAALFSLEKIPGMLREEAFNTLKNHLKKKHEVYLVSASCENWLSAWCEKNNIKLIASRLDTKDQKLTGKLKGKNCYGPEKVCRINEIINLKDYDQIYAYGDSVGDWEMLALANHKLYKLFK